MRQKLWYRQDFTGEKNHKNMPEAVDGHPPHPYIPNTEAQQREMLATIGVGSVEALFDDIPAEFRFPELNLPPALASEQALMAHMRSLAARNTPGTVSFLGGGAYRHFVPSVVGEITGRDEVLTAYTPYQPEVSQGTLQGAWEYQSMVCNLYVMGISNTGMYDLATALAEGALMSARITGRRKILLLDSVHPNDAEVVAAYCDRQGIQVEEIPARDFDAVDDKTAAVVIQSPNYFGYIETQDHWRQATKERGALMVVSANPISLGLLPPPGEFDADIAVGEGRSLGNHLSLGGVNLGIFTTKEQYLRQMPGRIVGRTTDRDGRVGYVLTIQTREQHIKRERATSNICTAEQLVALAATVSMTSYGPEGMRELAEQNFHKAHYAAAQIAQIPGYQLLVEGDFFNEFVIGRPPMRPSWINHRLLQKGIIGGIDVSSKIPHGLLLCVTEMHTREQINLLVKALGEVT